MEKVTKEEKQKIYEEATLIATRTLATIGARGACSGISQIDFFSKELEDIRKAKAVCDRCPIQETCRDYALRFENYGVWGGTTAKERKSLRQSLGIKFIDIFFHDSRSM